MDQLKQAWAELTAAGAAFEMTDMNVLGNEMRVFKAAPPSMRMLWEMAAGYSDRDYIVYEDERYTYAEIDAQVRSLAAALVERFGVGSGDRVAIAMRNYPEWVVGYWATICTGAAVVGMNAWWTSAEMEFGLRDSAPKVLIADGERLARVAPLLNGLRAAAPLEVIAVRAGDTPKAIDVLAWGDVVRPDEAPAALPPAVIDADDDACIFYTSGTTGAPKGAQLTHRGSVSNLMNLAFWSTVSGLATAKAAVAAGGVPPATASSDAQSVYMAPTPLFHVTANNCLLQPCTLTGGRIVLTYRWDPARALELIEREGVTNFSGVPTMSRELLAHPDWGRRNTSSLAAIGGGGAALQPDLVAKIDATVDAGVPSTGYGLTETNGIVTANSAAFFVAKPASCGPAMPTFDVRLVDDDGTVLAPGSVGQLCVKGPSVIRGYLNRPEATAEDIQEGYFNTGDIAKIDDDGFIYIVDRAKDMVLRGGENVYCSEVESAIYTNAAVAEVVVFGIPDERLGEEVGAALVLHAGAVLTEDDLRAHLGERIAKHKIPSRVWFLDEQLPRNANGKFVKREVKARLLA
ncbi:MAG: class I adenylate-forming enzyme family protein [Ilumatobacteraceae bacterium]